MTSPGCEIDLFALKLGLSFRGRGEESEKSGSNIPNWKEKRVHAQLTKWAKF